MFDVLVLSLITILLIKAISCLIQIADGIGKVEKKLDEIKSELEEMKQTR